MEPAKHNSILRLAKDSQWLPRLRKIWIFC